MASSILLKINLFAYTYGTLTAAATRELEVHEFE